MNYYEIWCNLKDSHADLEFARALRSYLGHLKEQGRIHDFRLARRKLGFGPPELGEFHVTIETENLVQLDAVFDLVATRDGETERLHAAVYSRVTDFKAALYRDFPDPERNARTAGAR